MADFPQIHCAGEAALIVYLDGQSSPRVSARVQALARALRETAPTLLVDLIPSYASLLVLFDPMQSDHFHMRRLLRELLSDAVARTEESDGRLVELPAYYHPDAGEDLLRLADERQMDWEEIVAIHAAQEYRVYAIGFAPGFAYLGDVDPRIAAPRLATPRQRVPRGAVAIADRQTAVYPAPSPGGWNLIGRSPQRMFDAGASPPMPMQVGDRVRFVSVDRSSFIAAGGSL